MLSPIHIVMFERLEPADSRVLDTATEASEPASELHTISPEGLPCFRITGDSVTRLTHSFRVLYFFSTFLLGDFNRFSHSLPSCPCSFSSLSQ